jgi:hypothetical protein
MPAPQKIFLSSVEVHDAEQQALRYLQVKIAAANVPCSEQADSDVGMEQSGGAQLENAERRLRRQRGGGALFDEVARHGLQRVDRVDVRLAIRTHKLWIRRARLLRRTRS